MSLVVKLIISCVVGYLLGSANSSLIVGKFYGVDVRRHGSGNAGATNTLRTLGKTAALFVILGDALKGVIACIIGNLICGRDGLMAAGIASIIGHNWPLYFRFKGGKGVLTSFTVAILIDWKVSLILFGIFIIIVAITRFISLGSVVAASLFPVAAFLHESKNLLYIAIAFILGALIVIRHRSNIVRIYNGTESKLGAKKAVKG
jgi:glycerol-3-phosphate acyltransferase PlsY